MTFTPDYGNALEGQIALVTGGGRGIGRTVAIAYAQAGAAVAVAARTADDLDDVVAAIEGAGGRAVAVPTDVTDLAAVDAMVEKTVGALGGLDILFANHGIDLAFREVADSDPAAWKATLDINLLGAYYCARAAIPHLQARGGGKIIFTGSGMGHRGSAGMSAYSVAKAGVWMLTRVLAQELWESGISVNELVPGPVDTNFGRYRPSDLPLRPGPASSSSEWRKQPEDVVPLALFLATQPAIGPTAQSFNLMRRDG